MDIAKVKWEKVNNSFHILTLGVQCQDQTFYSYKISPNGVDQKNQFPVRQLNDNIIHISNYYTHYLQWYICNK